MPSNNPIETLFMSFCKQLLGVQKQSMNDGVLLEIGQFPLMILAKKRAVKNWVMMATNTNCNAILQDSFQFSTDRNLLWPENMKAMLSEIGLMQSFVSQDSDAHLKAFQRLQDIYHQTAFERIKNGSSRLRTYGLFKTTPGFENYLDELSSLKERTALTKLRLSNHKLMIEKGRHSSIHRDLRFCPFCPNKVENEKHFLLECQTYKYLRADLYTEAKTIIPSICNQPHDLRFLSLMGATMTTPLYRFTSRAMELRDFLNTKQLIR